MISDPASTSPSDASYIDTGFSNESDRVQLIIGIDYGTSFSGAAYTLFLQRPNNPRIDTISDWPSAHRHHRYTPNVPSDIAYGANGEVVCGFECAENASRLKWVKLLLETDPDCRRDGLLDSIEIQHTRTEIQELEKSPVTLVGDYLKWLWARIVECICDEQNDPDLLDNSEVTIVMTVPAIWSDAAKENTLHAAELAGLAENGRDIKFITEPEAAAISELQQRVNTGQIKEGDCVIVCDAGGGTVDVVSYSVAKAHPMELDQVVVADGSLCGSTYINQAFTSQIASILQDDWTRLEDSARREITDRFTYMIKPSYDGSPASGSATIRLEDSSQLGIEHIKEGKVVIESQLDMAIEAKGLRSRFKGILLIGGLGSSKFIQSRVEQSYPKSEGSKVWRGRSSWTSVVEGAVRCVFLSLGNYQTVNTRLSRWNYGIAYDVPFDPSQHRVEDMFYCKEELCSKSAQIEWLVRRGQEIKDSAASERYDFHQIVPDHPLGGDWLEIEFTIVQSGENDAPTHYTSAVKECAYITCGLTPDLRIAARLRRMSMRGANRSNAWKVFLTLELHMLAAKVKFVMKMADEDIGATQVLFRQPFATIARRQSVQSVTVTASSRLPQPRGNGAIISSSTVLEAKAPDSTPASLHESRSPPEHEPKLPNLFNALTVDSTTVAATEHDIIVHSPTSPLSNPGISQTDKVSIIRNGYHFMRVLIEQARRNNPSERTAGKRQSDKGHAKSTRLRKAVTSE